MKKSSGEKVFFRFLALGFLFAGCWFLRTPVWYLAPLLFNAGINELIAVNKEES